MKLIQTLSDWINDNPWLVVCAIILSFFMRCASTDRADTIRLQERANSTIDELDKAEKNCIDDDCVKAIQQARELIKDSLDTLSEKDNDIANIQEQIKDDEFFTDVGKFVVYGAIVAIILLLLYLFRDNIFQLLKIAKPF